MHLKKTKKTPRMFRMIALMLSLVLVFKSEAKRVLGRQ